jgi:splicing factor 3B subunit 3
MSAGAVEKQKFVYVFNRDDAARLTISSPLESHRSHCVNFALVGVDVGYDNPIFAVLELEYGDADADPSEDAVANTPKALTYYELDLGLNHVVRKWSEETEPSANHLIAVPGGEDGPGGVLVCCENKILYRKPDHEVVAALIPRRAALSADATVLIASSTTMKQKKGQFFFLLQSEFGDVYKVTLEFGGGAVSDIAVHYFDTIPLAAAICLLRNGVLYVASECSNKYRPLC